MRKQTKLPPTWCDVIALFAQTQQTVLRYKKAALLLRNIQFSSFALTPSPDIV
jgi:hypothetical protein